MKTTKKTTAKKIRTPDEKVSAPSKVSTLHYADRVTGKAMCNGRIDDPAKLSAVATQVTCKTCRGWLDQRETRLEKQLKASIDTNAIKPKIRGVNELKPGAIITKTYKGSKGRVSGVAFFGLAAGSSPGRKVANPATLLTKAAELVERARKLIPVTKRGVNKSLDKAIASMKLAAKLS